MVIFLLVSVPLSYGFLMSLILPPRRYSRELWFWFFRGILTFIPAYILFLLMRKIVGLGFTPFGIFAYYFYHDAFLLPAFGVAGYLLLSTYFPHFGGRHLAEALSFLSGYFTFVAAADFVRHFGGFDPYLLFLLPIMRLSTILVFAVLLPRALDQLSSVPYLLIGAGILYLAVTAAVPLLSVLHFAWLAIALTAVIAAGSSYFFWLNRDR